VVIPQQGEVCYRVLALILRECERKSLFTVGKLLTVILAEGNNVIAGLQDIDWY